MIVKPESPITRIPRDMPPKIILLLEGIRYSANMALVSYGRLRATLHAITLGDKLIDLQYAVFVDAWNVLDSTHRFVEILKRFERKGDNGIISDLEKVTRLRNTFHHLDERIEEHFIEAHFPLFGILNWVYYDPDVSKTEFKIYTLIPGVQQGSKKIPQDNPLGKTFRPPIDSMTLTSVTRTKTEPPIKIDMVELIQNLEKAVATIEENLTRIYAVSKNKEDIFPQNFTMMMLMKLDDK